MIDRFKRFAAEWLGINDEDQEDTQEIPVPTTPVPVPKPPEWKTEIVVHPNYWVETHYDPLRGPTDETMGRLLKKGVEDGFVVNVQQKVHDNSVRHIFDSVRSQLKDSIEDADGNWRAKIEAEELSIELSLQNSEALLRAQNAWKKAKEIIAVQGVQLPQAQESWNQQKLSAAITVPLKTVKLDMTSPILWNVLHQNKDRLIIWEGKVWLPKEEEKSSL